MARRRKQLFGSRTDVLPRTAKYGGPRVSHLSASGRISVNDDFVVVDTSGGPVIVTLPPVSSVYEARPYRFANVGPGELTVIQNPVDDLNIIDGATSAVIVGNSSMSLSRTSATWSVMARGILSASSQPEITPYVVGTSAADPYSSIQDAIDAAEAAGVDALILVKPGTYVEDLTLAPPANITIASLASGALQGEAGRLNGSGALSAAVASQPSVRVDGTWTIDTTLGIVELRSINLRGTNAAGALVSHTAAATPLPLGLHLINCVVTNMSAGGAPRSLSSNYEVRAWNSAFGSDDGGWNNELDIIGANATGAFVNCSFLNDCITIFNAPNGVECRDCIFAEFSGSLGGHVLYRECTWIGDLYVPIEMNGSNVIAIDCVFANGLLPINGSGILEFSNLQQEGGAQVAISAGITSSPIAKHSEIVEQLIGAPGPIGLTGAPEVVVLVSLGGGGGTVFLQGPAAGPPPPKSAIVHVKIADGNGLAPVIIDAAANGGTIDGAPFVATTSAFEGFTFYYAGGALWHQIGHTP